tara:strand:- start:853 stop:1323 length:471 start_codon:yes stop_codon:yes gene_type:complete
MSLTEDQKHKQKLKMRKRREEVYRQEELDGIRPIYIKQKAKNKKIIEQMEAATRGTTLGSFMASKNKSDYHRIYYLQNYDRLTAKRKEMMKCATCGHTYLRANRARHRRSLVHTACLGLDYEAPLKQKRKLYSIDSKTKLNVFSKEKIPSTVITFD